MCFAFHSALRTLEVVDPSFRKLKSEFCKCMNLLLFCDAAQYRVILPDALIRMVYLYRSIKRSVLMKCRIHECFLFVC